MECQNSSFCNAMITPALDLGDTKGSRHSVWAIKGDDRMADG